MEHEHDWRPTGRGDASHNLYEYVCPCGETATGDGEGPFPPGYLILGTRVPDTPIHRASLWLQEVRFPEYHGGQAPTPREEDDYVYEAMAAEVPKLTPEQIKEATRYYAINLLITLTGGRLDVVLPSPTGEGYIDLLAVFESVWADAWMHGIATANGKTALSTAEKRLTRAPDPS